MAGKQLFPIFELPDVLQEEEISKIPYKKSWYFDFEKGDFALDGGNKVRIANEHEAWAQWCAKAVQTERYAYLAYSSDFGVELEEVRKQPTRQAAESMLERTITEALMVHPMTEAVRDFSFEWEGDSVTVTFTVYPRIGTPVTLNTTV